VEFIGYAARIASYNDTSKLGPYIIQQMFILLPPVLFAASIYMVLSRVLVTLHGERYSPLRPSRLTKTFVTGDIIAFYIQGGGGGMTAIGMRPINTSVNFSVLGQWVVIGGLVVQIVIFGLFCVTAFTFHTRFVKSVAAPIWDDWKKMMHMLYLVSGLVMIRSLFRIVEYATGADGYLMTHEWPLYVFDTILMFAVVVLFYFCHPDRIPGLIRNKGAVVRIASMGERTNPGMDHEDSYQLDEQRMQPKHSRGWS
jgi:hypothetical protein